MSAEGDTHREGGDFSAAFNQLCLDGEPPACTGRKKGTVGQDPAPAGGRKSCVCSPGDGGSRAAAGSWPRRTDLGWGRMGGLGAASSPRLWPQSGFFGGFPFGIFRLAQGDGSLRRAALMGGTSQSRGERRWQRDGMGGPGSAPLRASPGGPWLLATAPWHGRGHRWPP